MFGNNVSGPFMSSNMSYNPMMRTAPMMGMRNVPMMGIGNTSMMASAPRSGGFLSSLLGGNRAGGLLSGARSFNFGSLLNNASKALGVVKDAIPIVKEVGPMMGNMKSILKIASVFKDETDTTTIRRQNSTTTNISNTNETPSIDNTTKESDTRTSTTIRETQSNEPNFFL